MRKVDSVVFDVGNVLIGWDPDPLIEKLAGGPQRAAYIRRNVITAQWNATLDAGLSWAQGCAERAALFPDDAALIHAFNARWEETLFGAIDGTVSILNALAVQKVPLYALTNFSSEKFAITRPNYTFFDHFHDILVSGDEGMIKPDPAIFKLLLNRNSLDPARCVFIDDTLQNVESARDAGMSALHFMTPADLAKDLEDLGFELGKSD